MRILITGGAGFIGSRTALKLLQLGHQVSVLDNLLPQVHTADPDVSPTWCAVRDVVDAVIGDVRDVESVARALSDCDAVLHLAAETGTGQSMYEVERYASVNVGGTAILLEEVVRRRSQVRRVVVASSRSVYGEGAYTCAAHGLVTPPSRRAEDMARGLFEPVCPACQGPLVMAATREDSALKPASVYAVTKLAQEQLVASVCQAHDVPWMALRYQNVYGPGQSLNNPYTGVLSIFSRLMLASQPIEIFEDGAESRDFVYIDDIVEANVAALQGPPGSSGTVNVGSGVATSISRLVALLADQYGYRGSVRTTGRYRLGDIRHNQADVSLSASLLGLRAPTTMHEGVGAFCAWASRELAAAAETGAGDSYRRSLAELEDRGLIR